MEITFLGTGTSQGVPIITCECAVCNSSNPKDKRLRTSVLININNKNIVIDAGPDFRQQMLIEKVKTLDAIILTHEHKDHIAGIDDVRAFNYKQKKPSDIYAENRVLNILKEKEFYYAFEEKPYPGVPQINLHPIINETFFINDIEITPIRGLHYKLPVFGFRFKNFAYITDMSSITENELEKLKGLDVFVINALRRETHISHFTLNEALEIIERIKPQKSYLTHVSHDLGFYNDVMKTLPKNVYLAYDGLKLEC